MNVQMILPSRFCEICGDEDAITVCVIDGELTARCEIHAWGLLPETERTYWQMRNSSEELFIEGCIPDPIIENPENEI